MHTARHVYNISRPLRVWCSPGPDATVHVFFHVFRVQVMVCHVPLIIIRFGQRAHTRARARTVNRYLQRSEYNAM
jgi:hypothetical protein